MLRKLEELRTYPKSVRDRYAFLGAFLATAVIAVLWAVALPAQLVPPEGSVTEVEQDTSGGFARALSDMKAQMGTAFEAFREAREGFNSTDGEDNAAVPSNRIDIDAILASSSATSSGADTSEPNQPRVVLIATTSRSTTTNALNETDQRD